MVTIRKDVDTVCSACDECRKYGPKLRKVLAHSCQRYNAFESIAADYLSMPETAEGCTKMFVCIDVCTKFTWAWAIIGNPTQETTIACLNDLAQRYRLPYELISDNDTVIMGKDVQQIFPEITFTQCAPYSHVGAVENANHQILNRMRRFVNADIDDLDQAAAFHARTSWTTWLPSTLASLNNRSMEILGGLTPRDMMFGVQDDRLIPADFEARHRARMTLEDEVAAETQHHRTRRVQPVGNTFHPDQLVEIYNTKDVNNNRSIKKLYIKWFGPFRIVNVRRRSATIVDMNGKNERVVGFEFMREWQGHTRDTLVEEQSDDEDLEDEDEE